MKAAWAWATKPEISYAEFVLMVIIGGCVQRLVTHWVS